MGKNNIMVGSLLQIFKVPHNWVMLAMFTLPFWAVSPWRILWRSPLYAGIFYSLLFIPPLILLKGRFHYVGYFIFPIGYLIIGILSHFINPRELAPIFNLQNAVGLQRPEVYPLFIFIFYLFSILTMLIIINSVRNTDELIKQVAVLCLGAGIACLWGMASIIGLPFGGGVQGWAVPRLQGTATEAQVFASFLLAIIPVSFSLFMGDADRKRSFFWGMILFISCLAMVMTFGIAGWIGMAAGCVCVALFYVRYYFLRKWFYLVAIIGLIFLSVFSISYLTRDYTRGFLEISKKLVGVGGVSEERIRQGKSITEVVADSTIFSRVDREWSREAAWNMFRDNPWIGKGLGSYGFIYNKYRPSRTPPRPYLAKAHNVYFETLAETGILGFILFFGFWFGLVFKAVSFLMQNSENTLNRTIIIGLSANMLGLLVSGMSLGIFVHSYTWVTAALLLSAIRIASTKR